MTSKSTDVDKFNQTEYNGSPQTPAKGLGLESGVLYSPALPRLSRHKKTGLQPSGCRSENFPGANARGSLNIQATNLSCHSRRRQSMSVAGWLVV